MKNFWKELQKPFTALAPMEDVTDVVFRQIVDECGAPDVYFTEFTNAGGLLSPGRKRVGQRLKMREGEYPLVAQIWGKTPENYLKVTKELVEMGFDGVDINMGCPAKKIVKQGCCSALIDNPMLAGEIIAATKEGANGKIPVSVKTRMGFKTNKLDEWVSFLLDQDIDVLTMHGRLAKEMSKKACDWNAIARAVEIKNEKQSETLIIGNGDVLSLEEVAQKHKETGVDGVMIGRGIFQDPFVFNPNRSINDLSLEERFDLLLRHAQLFIETWGDTKPFVILRRFFKIYLSGFDGASDLRDKFMDTENLEEVRDLVKKYK